MFHGLFKKTAKISCFQAPIFILISKPKIHHFLLKSCFGLAIYSKMENNNLIIYILFVKKMNYNWKRSRNIKNKKVINKIKLPSVRNNML